MEKQNLRVKITKDGVLEIKRKGKWKKAFCPFDGSPGRIEGNVLCGDWCALFGEKHCKTGDRYVVIGLCRKDITVLPGEFLDEVVEIPVEATSPQVPLECSECHQMTGGPA